MKKRASKRLWEIHKCKLVKYYKIEDKKTIDILTWQDIRTVPRGWIDEICELCQIPTPLPYQLPNLWEIWVLTIYANHSVGKSIYKREMI